MSKQQPQELRGLVDEARRLHKLGDLKQAQLLYTQATELYPAYAPAWHAMGLIALECGELAESSRLIARALMIEPETALYHRDLGELLRRLGQAGQAVDCAQAAVKLAPRDADGYYNLGLALTDGGEPAKALLAYRKAVKLNPRHGLAWNNLGSVLEQGGDIAAARKAYERAVALDARHAEAQNNLGAIHSAQGRLDQARNCFAAAIDAQPRFVEAHYNLSSLKTYTCEDPHLAQLEALVDSRAALGASACIRYDFALGKAFDDIGQYDRAFEAYDEGNRLQHALLPMNERRADTILAHILSTFDEEFFAERGHWRGCEDVRTPVFIVGMPRSGTTLLEQILCSHPSLFGAGELADLQGALVEAVAPDPDFVQAASRLDELQMRALGARYIERVWKRSPKSSFISDKMPANFFYLGFIRLALPRAKVIHITRDPMDSCFSCFSRLFNDSMEFAYDQGTIGRYFVRYAKLMEHWRRVLPEGSVLELSYEKLVADTESEARRVLDYVGLPWDARVLEFHRNERQVNTASVAQVRKPVYQSSVARWKHFAAHLRPLWEIVRDYRAQDDFAEASAAAASSGSEVDAASSFRNAESWHIEGIGHYRRGHFDEALACITRALALRADFPEALNSKGFVLRDLGQLEEAQACFTAALKIAPELAMARLNLGLVQLKLGRWDEGWENYEARWTGSIESSVGKNPRPACPLPQWHGESPASGTRLLVITEQGFGDTFQFVRYLPLLAERFTQIGFVCSQPTLRLMEWSFGDTVTLMNRMPTDFGDWDLQCPLLSLPRAFGTRLTSVPAHVPYLKVARAAQASWRSRLERAAPGRLRIGISWAGRADHHDDARRSLRFAQVAPLIADRRFSWVNLQKWLPANEVITAPPGADWLDWIDDQSDFADSAALIASLDLVVSIDSAMVHLAGGLGRPVWMLNRFDGEWRWLDRQETSPWYPSLRIFNQPRFGDWASVLNEVGAALTSLAASSGPAASEARPPPAASSAAGTAPGPGELAELMAEANRHHIAGRLDDAQQSLMRLLSREPRHVGAIHLLGVLAYQSGQPARAIELLRKAVEIDDTLALIHSNLGEMLRQQGQIEAAIFEARRATEIEPAMAGAHSNLGVALYDAGDYAGSKLAHEKALALEPRLIPSMNNLGSIARKQHDLEVAATWYRRALALNPGYVEALSNLGGILVEQDRAQEATPLLQRALGLAPNSAEVLCNLGLAQLRSSAIVDARRLLQQALQVRPNYVSALLGLADIDLLSENHGEAELLARRAVASEPTMADAHAKLAIVLSAQGKAELAEESYRQALELDPGYAGALVGLGIVRLEAGLVEQGCDFLTSAVKVAPENISARFHLVQARKVAREDDYFVWLRERATQIETLGTESRVAVHYALGKAYHDMQDYPAAFAQFAEGARVKRASLQYDEKAELARYARVAEVFDARLIDRLAGAGSDSRLPVFVLGMPRSGTTLTEQILASHPKAFGAGELFDLMQIVQHPLGSGRQAQFPENFREITPEVLGSWGAEYVQGLTGRASDAVRITDKMPINYLGVGAIRLMLPDAKIIHVVRDPVDTCLSCFMSLFTGHQDATYDLAELGRMYRAYARLMAHWRSVVPRDRLFEVRYEDLVADTEAQARRLVEFCDLPWDDACLSFHKTDRVVRTASLMQVRQPVYSSSVARWRHYEKFLGPLFDALGDLAPAR